MPSPFPGMDPYLESRSIWREFHTWLITTAASELQPRLLERGYRVSVEGRVWLEDPERPIYPDVSVWERNPPATRDEIGAADEPADSPILVRVPKLKTRERYLLIRRVGSKRLVTAIEVLSPANKLHRRSRELYLKKRRELRAGGVNLVQIDLLRGGRPLVAVPPTIDPEQPGAEYVIGVIRQGSPFREVYPASMTKRLPWVRIPLANDDLDAVLDLQATVSRAYDEGGFRAEIDYRTEPEPRLTPETAAWSDALLIGNGLRQPKT